MSKPFSDTTALQEVEAVWTLGAIEKGCANFGIDLGCTACAEIFFTGGVFAAEHTCATDLGDQVEDLEAQIESLQAQVDELERAEAQPHVLDQPIDIDTRAPQATEHALEVVDQAAQRVPTSHWLWDLREIISTIYHDYTRR